MISSTDKQRRPTPEQLDFLQEAIAASSAHAAADRLGVLARLAAGPADLVTLARDCTISERGARLLLAALISLGLIEEAPDGSFSAAASDLAQLAAMITPWSHLAEAIRGDRPTMAGDTPGGAGTLYSEVVSYLGALFAPVAEHAADHLIARGLRDRVLDLGAGAAPWSLALAARNPDIRVTAVDLPAVLAVTRQVVATSGYDLQFDYLSGDLFTIDLGRSAYDLAIAGNLCHLFDEATNRRLLGRLFDAIRPGGTLAILDALPNERLDGPRPIVLYALGLLLRTNRGQVYPFSTYMGWLRDIGYEAVELIDLSPSTPPISLIMARRPIAEKEEE
ncbi:MAG TPA: class I SAM-dependent methyltransferase [Ktedonobacteraceae bacterium]|nr:class I SAM-dependent methyltransferase [Ktedonobacteraceae bacterium]